mgnify:FL=1
MDTDSSYLLLEDGAEQLTGIFTKSDLLKAISRNEDLNVLMDRPVHQYMSRNLKTINIDMIHSAPEFLVRNKLGHAPVVSINEQTQKHEIVGVVQQESLFQHIVKTRELPDIYETPNTRAVKRRLVGVLCGDGALFHLVDSVFREAQHIGVQRYRFGQFDLERVSNDVDALAVDLDGIPKRNWLPIVKEIVAHPGLEHVIVTYNPKTFEGEKSLFEKLQVNGYLKVIEKPFIVSQLIRSVLNSWSSSEA